MSIIQDFINHFQSIGCPSKELAQSIEDFFKVLDKDLDEIGYDPSSITEENLADIGKLVETNGTTIMLIANKDQLEVIEVEELFFDDEIVPEEEDDDEDEVDVEVIDEEDEDEDEFEDDFKGFDEDEESP